ncbi:MAG: cbb3-type cytochrome c oxidase subunit II [Verrucomicrobiota bacterium JB022]|nr:cbb3-type cytochrome c oxidase subunit II [Verrucomicrobiota bacterium JB022]
MRSLPLLFLGIFFTLAFSWTGIVLVTNRQLNDLDPVSSTLTDATETPISGVTYEDPDTGVVLPGLNQANEPLYPQMVSGSALRGQRVYEEMGCLYCHSQQVRRKGFGSDFERGWGQRQSVARDYIMQSRVMLGTMRTGPDLANVGIRYDATWQFQHLYNPKITSPYSIMPPYAFLFEEQKISETRGPSPEAIVLPGDWALEDGYELVPTQRAKDLVAYLLSLQQEYELPEMKFEQ